MEISIDCRIFCWVLLFQENPEHIAMNSESSLGLIHLHQNFICSHFGTRQYFWSNSMGDCQTVEGGCAFDEVKMQFG